MVGRSEKIGLGISAERALIRLETDHMETEIALGDGEVVSFGRAHLDSRSHLRFGHSPRDKAVPRVAGQLIAANQRIIVDSAVVPGIERQCAIPLKICEPSAPEFLLGVGAAYSPAEGSFEILVHGDLQQYRLTVLTRPREAWPERGDDFSVRQHLRLTRRQLEFVREYQRPMASGMNEPATHQQVADALGVTNSAAQKMCYSIWDQLWTLAIPMDMSTERRAAVARTLLAYHIDEID